MLPPTRDDPDSARGGQGFDRVIPDGGLGRGNRIITAMSDTTSGQQPPDPGDTERVSTDAGTTQAEAGAQAEHEAPAGSVTRRLVRRTDRRVLGGVASGLAAYFDIDPVIVRLGLVAFGFLTGPLALLLYLIAWAVVPPDTNPYRQRDGGVPTWVWIVLVVLGLFVLPPLFFGSFGPGFDGPGFDGFDGPGFDGFVFWRPGFFWALILIGLGILLFRRNQTAPALDREGGRAAATLPPSTPPPPTRPPSILGRLTVAGGLLVMGLAAVLDNVGLLDLSVRRFLGLLLAVVGLGLLIGAWWGSARWLIVVGAVLIPLLFLTSWFSFMNPRQAFRGQLEFGDRTVRPTTLAQVADPIQLSFGELALDLTALPLTDDPTEVTADVEVGQIDVVVPNDAAVDVQARVGAGQITVFGERRGGRGAEVEVVHPGTAGSGRLALDLDLGRGNIVVREQGDASPPQSPAPLAPLAPPIETSPPSQAIRPLTLERS
jgi:phage shock protein PspC (stress-responsive transcriptional regulator)